jgi:hypothetical protein
MILGQLWYGWAPRGLEGVNQEQIVAGSGNLGSRASSLTQMVLPWCYYQKTGSRGWIERDGVGVAFRRTPTGRDARGREGAFFVHAVVWEHGTMPASLLTGLWDATFWVTGPPDDPPARLEPIRGEAELGLGDALIVDDETLSLTLAGVLENLAGSRLSALDLPPAQAYGVASQLAAVLPPKFGLISFSSYEERDRAEAYDLVAGNPAGSHHTPVGPGTQPGDHAREAARLMLLASSGDAGARDVVSLIADRSNSLREFADRMRRWAALELASVADRQVDAESFALLVDAPQLVSSLQGSGALRRLTSEQAVALATALTTSEASSPVTSAVLDELTSAPGLAGALACAESLPVEWRARAAAAEPGEVPGHALADAIAHESGYASIFVNHMGRTGLRLLEQAIAQASMPLAFDCARRAAAHLEADRDRIALVWPAILRLPAREQLEALNGYAQLDAPLEAVWADAAIKSLVECVLDRREEARALARVSERALDVEVGPKAGRIEAWRKLGRIVQETDPLQVDSAMRQVAALTDAREVDAALEIVVDAICEHAGYRSDRWSAALRTFALRAGEPDATLAHRLVRASLRNGAGDRTALPCWTVLWIAAGIDEETISRDITREPFVEALVERLRCADAEAVSAYADQRPRRAASRRWLKHVEKAARRRGARRRWLFHSR